MGRSLYSLILSDDIISGIDKIAMRMNTNRSVLVNQILADYLSIMTPEKRIEGIFKSIEQLLTSDTELVPHVLPNQSTMSVKSCLDYKYRPTIKYSVKLYRVPDNAIGEMTVSFRTQSIELLKTMTEFFRFFKKLEDAYIKDYYPHNSIKYELYDGKFIRSIPLRENKEYETQELSNEITQYVRMFDTLMKNYIYGKMTEIQIEKLYAQYLKNGIGLI